MSVWTFNNNTWLKLTRKFILTGMLIDFRFQNIMTRLRFNPDATTFNLTSIDSCALKKQKQKQHNIIHDDRGQPFSPKNTEHFRPPSYSLFLTLVKDAPCSSNPIPRLTLVFPYYIFSSIFIFIASFLLLHLMIINKGSPWNKLYDRETC